MHEDEADAPPVGPSGGEVERSGATRSPVEARDQWRAHLLLVAVLAPILIVALVAGGYMAYLDHVVQRNVRQEQLLPGGDQAPARRTGAGAAENYLLVGLDKRPDVPGPGRADVIIWMHVDKGRDRVDLIHFPRDYEVDIPGYGRNKVNTAYSLGGTPLLVETLQPMLSTPLDHVVVADFEGFSRMTDAVGGVDVTIPEAMASPQFPAGTRHLDGRTALTFVRERKALDQQDISRGQRQELYLKALLVKSLSNDVLNDPVKLARFVDAGTQNLVLDQNFPHDQLRDKAYEMRGVKGDAIHFWSAPWVGVGEDARIGSLVYPNPWLLQDLGQSLAEDTMPRYTDDETPQTGFAQTPEQERRTAERRRTATATPTAVGAPPSRPQGTSLD